MSAKKQGYSPRSEQGVNFFDHFPRQRLHPYSEIKEATRDSVMLEKATPINCEYIMRPSDALSEMADTISTNKNTLKDMLTSIDISNILAKVDKMNDVVRMFNTRTDLPVKQSDVHKLLKYSIADDDDDTDNTFDTMEHLGMMLYVMGSHQKKFHSLLRNTME